MAAFLAMTMWEGEFTDDYLATPAPDAAQLGLPGEDDGSRDDPLLGREAVVFPSHHGGFGAEDGPWPGRPREFAARLREVLAQG